MNTNIFAEYFVAAMNKNKKMTVLKCINPSGFYFDAFNDELNRCENILIQKDDIVIVLSNLDYNAYVSALTRYGIKNIFVLPEDQRWKEVE